MPSEFRYDKGTPNGPQSTTSSLRSSTISSAPISTIMTLPTTLSPSLAPSHLDQEKSPAPTFNEVPAPFRAHVPSFPPLNPMLPSPDARADDVRAYLFEMCQRRGLDDERARAVASLWTMGTGRELRVYTVAVYREVFGADGWVLYKDVKTQVYEEEGGVWRPTRGRLSSTAKVWLSIFGLFMFCVFVAGVVLGFYMLEDSLLAVPVIMLLLGLAGTHFAFLRLSSASWDGGRLMTAPKVLISLYLATMLGMFGGGAALCVLLVEDYWYSNTLVGPVFMLVFGISGVCISAIRLCSRSRKVISSPDKKAEQDLVDQWDKPFSK